MPNSPCAAAVVRPQPRHAHTAKRGRLNPTDPVSCQNFSLTLTDTTLPPPSSLPPPHVSIKPSKGAGRGGGGRGHDWVQF